MEYVSEDPTYLAGGLALLAGALLVATRVTQQGKYLLWGLGALGLAAVVVAVEWFWVTDNERIEQVVQDIRRAVAASDADGVLDHMTDSAELVIRGVTVARGEEFRGVVRGQLSSTEFDFVRVSQLEANANTQSRRGTARFRVLASGTSHGASGFADAGAGGSTWSLSFRETEPKVWKVTQVHPLEIPGGVAFTPGGVRPPPRITLPTPRGSNPPYRRPPR